MDIKAAREEIESNITIAMLSGSQATRIQCPFHKSADLDLALYQEDNRWRCFGTCDDGKTHTIFDWVMWDEGCDFKTAFQMLADRAGVSLRPNKERVDILSGAQSFYHDALMKNPTALAYLQSRGFNEQHAFQRQLGYAEDGVIPNNVVLNDLHRVGLVGYNLRVYPYFRNRITYPIYDKTFSLIQLQGRIFPEPETEPGGKKPPKYLGLPGEVELRGRSIWQCLGGEDILANAEEVVLTEGWPDRETLTAWGIPAVNLFGHTGIDKHYHRLKHLKRIYTVLDPDDASQKRILTELYKLGIKIPNVEIRNVVLNTGGLDVNAWAMIDKPEGETLSKVKDAAKIEQFNRMCALSGNLLDDLITNWTRHSHLIPPLAQYIGRLPDPEPWVYKLANKLGEREATVRFLVKVLAPEKE